MSSVLIYQSVPHFAWWFKLVISAVILLTLTPAMMLLAMGEVLGGYVMLGATALDALLFYIIIPRSYDIYSDKVVIKLAASLSIRISFDTLNSVRKAPSSYALAYWGLRFATQASGVIELKRAGGFDVVISPSNPESFLEQLERALAEYKQSPN